MITSFKIARFLAVIHFTGILYVGILGLTAALAIPTIRFADPAGSTKGLTYNDRILNVQADLAGFFDIDALPELQTGSLEFQANLTSYNSNDFFTTGLFGPSDYQADLSIMAGSNVFGRIEGILNNLVGDVGSDFSADTGIAVIGPVAPIRALKKPLTSTPTDFTAAMIGITVRDLLLPIIENGPR